MGIDKEDYVTRLVDSGCDYAADRHSYFMGFVDRDYKECPELVGMHTVRFHKDEQGSPIGFRFYAEGECPFRDASV